MSDARRLTYRPGLDGLRALAVGAVLLYHLPVEWARGGWLGVSAFFVLSGYLITTLLLTEQAGTGAIRLSAFWARRFRRLLPASLACLALIIAFVAADLLPVTPTLRGDLLAALLDVENWRAYATGGYDALWRAPSPVLHFWSLAIEEQWYLIWPLVVTACLARSRRVLAVVIGVGLAGSVIAGALVSPELAYLATFTRSAELLVGGALALVLTRWSPRPSAWLTGAGSIGLVAVLAAFVLVPIDSPVLFTGGLLVFALVVGVVVTATVTPGPLASALSVAPLVWLGLRSYGVYLFHWPLYLVFEGQGWSTWWAIPVTFALAEVSYRVIEQPIRRGTWFTAAQARTLAPTAMVVVGLGAFAVTPAASGAVPDIEVLAGLAPASTAPTTAPRPTPTTVSAGVVGSTTPTSGATTAPPAPTTTLPPRSLRIAVVGDSTANALGKGLEDWGAATGRASVKIATIDGCGIIRNGSLRFGTRSQVLDVPEGCRDWATRWPKQLASEQAEVVMVTIGPWEWIPRRWQGSGGWVLPTDETYRQMLAAELAAATDVLSGDGRRVVWVTAAPIYPGWDASAAAAADPSTNDAQRRAANDVLREVVASRPGVELVDLASWLDANPQVATDQALRPDGVHWARPAAAQVVSLLMEPVLAGLATS